MQPIKLITLATLLLYGNFASGQFAVVYDTDGFVFVRREAKKGNNIVDTLKNGQVVWCWQPTANWHNIECKRKGVALKGYVYKNRLKFLDSFDTIPAKVLLQNKLVLGKDSIKVTITTTSFDPTQYKLGFVKGAASKYISTINGKPFLGTDGEIPKRMYQCIEITVGKRQITLGKAEIEYMFEPNLGLTACYWDKENNILYLTADNSDGAGGYAVLWVIEKGAFKERIEVNSF